MFQFYSEDDSLPPAKNWHSCKERSANELRMEEAGRWVYVSLTTASLIGTRLAPSPSEKH
jgi:hypothetical protein